MAELAEKYRDRAKERREGKNPDYQAEDPSQAGMGGYRAVAPDLKSYVSTKPSSRTFTVIIIIITQVIHFIRKIMTAGKILYHARD